MKIKERYIAISKIIRLLKHLSFLTQQDLCSIKANNGNLQWVVKNVFAAKSRCSRTFPGKIIQRKRSWSLYKASIYLLAQYQWRAFKINERRILKKRIMGKTTLVNITTKLWHNYVISRRLRFSKFCKILVCFRDKK